MSLNNGLTNVEVMKLGTMVSHVRSRDGAIGTLTRLITFISNIHYSDVIMSAMGSQITNVSIVCSIVSTGADQIKHPLLWRHNGCDSVSNHQPHHCLLNRLFRRRSKKTSKLCVTGLCVGNSPETGEFPAQMASNAEKVSIWWRHHESSVPLAFVGGIHRRLVDSAHTLLFYLTFTWLFHSWCFR